MFDLTPNDIIFAAVASFFITFSIKQAMFFYRALRVDDFIKIDYDKRNLARIIKSCCALFPKEKVMFQGDTFTRGTKIQIFTISNHILKGELIGQNDDDIVCIITTKSIITQDMSQILIMAPLNEDIFSDFWE